MMKRLERLKNNVNKYMADLRPTSQNGSWSQSTIRSVYLLKIGYTSGSVIQRYTVLKILLYFHGTLLL
jgi:hypothetical protein